VFILMGDILLFSPQVSNANLQKFG
jgi:hypothetical protein